jgi:hypothetical protein
VLILKPMKTPVSWIAVLALSALAATAGSVVLQSPAGADPIGDCSTTTGEIVAVDFSAWGGDIERGCDAVLTTGYAALHRAGFTTAGDAQDGDAFICRIDDKPPPKQQSCGTTPPADAYWSYWHADVGQDTWTYSQQGAMGYHPPPGSVDAWTFGSTDIDGTTGQPTFSPESVRATNTSGSGTTTTTTTSAPAGTTPPGTTPPGTVPGHSPTPSTTPTGAPPPVVRGSSSTTEDTDTGGAQHSRTTTTEPGSTAATTTLAPTPAPTGGTPHTKIVDAAPVATNRQSAGSAAPALVGTAIVLVLAAVAGVVAWRRRRIS